MVRIPRVFRVVAAVCVAFAAVPIAVPAVAQTVQTLAPGQTTTITDTGVPLSPPADGRLESYGTTVHIDGVAFAAVVPGLAAAPGAELVVLHLTTIQDDDTMDSSFLVNHPVSLAVQSGSVSAPLTTKVQWNIGYPSPDDEYYAAAVPKSGPADLTLSVGGLLPQTFDLRAGHRVGNAPAVLYRDANQPDVIVKSTAVSSFTASSASGPVTGQFGVARASLQYWQPYSTTLAPSPDQAYLDVEFAHSKLSVPGYTGDETGPAEALPAGAVTFVLSNGQTVTAVNSLDPTQLFDIFSGDFYAPVPAATTSAKVVVTLGSLSIQVPATNSYDSQQIPIHFAAPLTQSVDFPAPWSPHASANARSPAASPPRAVPPGHHGSGGGFPWPLVLAAVAVVAVLAGAGINRRRRLALTVTPVSWPPRRLSPAAIAVLSPARRALPRGEPHVIGVDGAPVPDQPPGEAEPAVVILLLGPLQVEGLTKRIGRRSVIRLLVVLAVTPERPMGGDELAMAVSARPTRDPRVESLQSYASVLRAGLPAGMLPDADGDGYHLDHSRMSVDWLALAAVAEESPDTPEWAGRATGALELVRGRPLEGSRWEGIEPAARAMEATIEGLARRLAAHLLESGDPVGAEAAVARGLTGVPGAVSLWQARLEAAAAGSGYGLERAWADARTDLGADAALIADVYQRLRRQIADRPSANA